MKKVLTFIFIIFSFVAVSQVSNTKVVRVANATTAFSVSLSQGNILIDLNTDKAYLIIKAVPGTASLSTLTEDVDYTELSSFQDLSSYLEMTDTTSLVATKSDLTGGTGSVSFLEVNADTLSSLSVSYSDTYWDDLQVNISSVRLHPSNQPTWTAYKGGYVLSFDEGDDDEIYFVAQLPHKYMHGSNIEFHLHLAFPDGNSGDVDWTFTYSWANMGDAFPAFTTVNTQISSPGVADKHLYSVIINPIDGTGKKGSSVLICSLTRNGGSANDTYSNNVYLVALDFHHQVDKPGSNNIMPD